MDKFAIQRMSDGAYVAAQPDTLDRNAANAYLFVNREAAQQYIRDRLPADVRFGVARLPEVLP